MFKISLGAEVKDKVSGFKGTVTSRTEYLNKCIRYAVDATKLKDDGSRHETLYFDEEQLEVLGVWIKVPDKERTGGGPDPIQRPNPQR